METAAVSAPPAVAAAAPWAPVGPVGSTAVKRAFAVFQKGGVIMDVTNGDQARAAEAPTPTLNPGPQPWP